MHVKSTLPTQNSLLNFIPHGVTWLLAGIQGPSGIGRFTVAAPCLGQSAYQVTQSLRCHEAVAGVGGG